MAGKIIAICLLLVALIAGGSMYYLQVYAFYEELPAEVEVNLVSLTTGGTDPVAVNGFTGIDSDSSPVRFRACFEVTLSIASLSEGYVIAERPEPLVAPEWFECFDAAQIGADLETGQAVAFLGARNVPYGIDRIVAVYPDGTAYSWTQINECGERVFDGDPPPEGCPPAPERLN